MPGAFTYTVATNLVTVTGGTSGSLADFSSFVAVDRANAATLLAAWSPNSNTKAGYLDGAISDIPTVAEILAGTVEGSLTLEQVLRIVLAAPTGKINVTDNEDGTLTIKVRDLADTKDRIVLVANVSGERLSSTLDGS